MSRSRPVVIGPMRGPGGNAIWRDRRGNSYYWNGPGARLKLMFGDQLVSIDHPTANDSYETIKAASAAVRRFVRYAISERRTGE